jgi:coenzyme F420 biosynthesis associated uncharacterized protein
MNQKQPRTNSDRSVSVATAGVVAGAALGVWATNRVKEFAGQDRPEGMINWQRTRDIATGMNKGDTLTVAERDRLNAYYGDLVAKCIPIVSNYTGAVLPTNDQRTFAFDRVDWIDANLNGFKRMFEPIEDLDSPSAHKGTFSKAASGVNQAILSYEIGLLLGYLARRVLGQYDLALLGREPLESSGKLYYVEPNIRGIESKLGLPKDEFRMWLALHETTHVFEFEAYPWVREHFNALLDRYMTYMKDDAQQLAQGMRGLKVFANRARQRNSDDQGSWIEAFMNDEQRALFNEMQSMMCVIEGYSNHVMNAVGRDLLTQYDEISRKFEERQKQRTQAEKLFARLTGLNVKMEQYQAGERFIDRIVKARGHDFAVRVWSAPEFLPTMAEIRSPETWIERIDAMGPREVFVEDADVATVRD